MKICSSLTVVLQFRFCPQPVAICGVLWPVSVSVIKKEDNTATVAVCCDDGDHATPSTTTAVASDA